MLYSLVENCARRRHDPVELLHDVSGLKQRGYTDTQIAGKTGLTPAYVKCVIHLTEKAEQRLLRGVAGVLGPNASRCGRMPSAAGRYRDNRALRCCSPDCPTKIKNQ